MLVALIYITPMKKRRKLVVHFDFEQFPKPFRPFCLDQKHPRQQRGVFAPNTFLSF
jgi:hypothetical protein